MGDARSIDVEYIGPDGNATAAVDITVNGGATYAITVNAVPAATLDRDTDGIPDLVEIAHGLNPLFAGDALEDADGDLRNNLDEHLDGGQINVADTGDINDDQVVGIDDLLWMQQHLIGMRSLDSQAISRADADRDGVLSVHDLLYLQNRLTP